MKISSQLRYAPYRRAVGAVCTVALILTIWGGTEAVRLTADPNIVLSVPANTDSGGAHAVLELGKLQDYPPQETTGPVLTEMSKNATAWYDARTSVWQPDQIGGYVGEFRPYRNSSPLGTELHWQDQDTGAIDQWFAGVERHPVLDTSPTQSRRGRSDGNSPELNAILYGTPH